MYEVFIAESDFKYFAAKPVTKQDSLPYLRYMVLKI